MAPWCFIGPAWTSTAPLLSLHWASAAPLLHLGGPANARLLDSCWTSSCGFRLDFYLASYGTPTGSLLRLACASTAPPLRFCWSSTESIKRLALESVLRFTEHNGPLWRHQET